MTELGIEDPEAEWKRVGEEEEKDRNMQGPGRQNPRP